MIVQGIKRRVGHDFPVQVRMNAIEIGGGEEGFSIEEGKELAVLLETAGVDSLHVKSHWMGMHQASFNPRRCSSTRNRTSRSVSSLLSWTGAARAPGAQLPLAAVIKQVVSIPVMTVGASWTPTSARWLCARARRT